MMRKRIVVAALVAWAAVGVGNAVAETLEEAWQTAMAQSHVVKAGVAMREAAEHAVDAAQRKRLPSVDLQANYMRLEESPQMRFMHMQMPLAKDETHGYGAVATLPIFTGGRITQGVRAAEALEKKAASELRGTEQDVKLAVAEYFVAVLQARRALAVAEQHEKTLQAHAEDVEKLFKKGYVVKSDRLAADVWVKNARQEVIRAQNALAMASAAYNRLLGRSLDEPVQIEELKQPKMTPESENALVARAQAQNAAMAGITHSEQALSAQVKAEKGAYLPQIALAGGWMRQDDPYLVADKGWMVGVTMKWNLLDGGVRAANVGELNRKRAALEQKREEAASLVALHVRQALLSINEANARLLVAQSSLAQAEENLHTVSERYRHGLVTQTRVLDAETLRHQSDMNAMFAHYDVVLAGLRLKHAVSEL